MVKRSYNYVGKTAGEVTIGIVQRISFDNDKGKTTSDISNGGFTKLDGGLDDQISILLHEPESVMTITGSATDKPTDIEGQATEVTSENNITLAKLRAEAGKLYVIEYAEKNYGTDVAAQISNQIRTNHVVVKETGNEQDDKSNRSITFETK